MIMSFRLTAAISNSSSIENPRRHPKIPIKTNTHVVLMFSSRGFEILKPLKRKAANKM